WVQGVVAAGVVEEFVVCAAVGAAAAGFGVFMFVEFVVRVGGEGVLGLIVFVGCGEGMGGLGGGGAWEGAVAAEVEGVADGDCGGG
ncbi:MAG: hypothetical protein Q9203_005749, partial [Teloschistes exilis]